MQLNREDSARSGIVAGLLAYLWWGLVTALYYRELDQVHVLELISWRALGGLPICLAILAMPPGLSRLREAMRSPGALRMHGASVAMLVGNWFVFIYAVREERLTEASLGYFLNPLVSVLLGRFFLGEKLVGRQGWALGLAGVGVVVFAASLWRGSGNFLEGFVWIPLVLALSFGFYGLLRKQMTADSITGLTIEVLLIFPFFLGIELWLMREGVAAIGRGDPGLDFLLLAGGLVTVVPLALFGFAAQRLRLSTVGLLQYVSPTCQFILAVLVFGEPLTAGRLIAFLLIWSALGLYSRESWLVARLGAARP
ncbi:MAG: EamA family transporter RarD [Candidatus Binatia bacterium]|nr:EamA family transporter RarD [Candidatus Binatia bacterium]